MKRVVFPAVEWVKTLLLLLLRKLLLLLLRKLQGRGSQREQTPSAAAPKTPRARLATRANAKRCSENSKGAARNGSKRQALLLRKLQGRGSQREQTPKRSPQYILLLLIGILIPRNVPDPNVDADRCQESAANSRKTRPFQWVRYHIIRRVASLAWLCPSLPPRPSRVSALDRAKEAIGWIVLTVFLAFSARYCADRRRTDGKDGEKRA